LYLTIEKYYIFARSTITTYREIFATSNILKDYLI